MRRSFKFVYSFADDEIPEAWYISVNNITNAKKKWEYIKGDHEVLLAISESINGKWKEIWRSDIETGYQLDVVH
jgi:hypothetical protein